VRGRGRAGASQWATETKKRFVTPSKKSKVHDANEGSEMSAGSVIIVDAKEDGSLQSQALQTEGG